MRVGANINVEFICKQEQTPRLIDAVVFLADKDDAWTRDAGNGVACNNEQRRQTCGDQVPAPTSFFGYKERRLCQARDGEALLDRLSKRDRYP